MKEDLWYDLKEKFQKAYSIKTRNQKYTMQARHEKIDRIWLFSRRQLNEKRNKKNTPLDPEGRSFHKLSTSRLYAIPMPTKVHIPVDIQH